MSDWNPDLWRQRTVLQQPTYPDPDRLEAVVRDLASLPPLVTSWEVERLKEQLAEAARGRRFLLQGGACAESFDRCTAETVTNKLKILLQMSLVLTYGLKRQIIRVGRFAGQYAKPRSADTETRDGVTLPSYRGDLVNEVTFERDARRPDPDRLLRGYERSAITLNFIRALVEGGFADLHHPEYWDLDFVSHSPRAQEYQRMVESISDSLGFMETLAGIQAGQMRRVDFFTSHECLHLPYEQAQTRRVPHRDGWYNLAAHFPWVGVRTSQPDGAHVEFARGVQNPIGRLTLIHRFGHERIAGCLPPLIEEVENAGVTVLWCCDPMHGNTETLPNGLKTRRFDNILSELEQSFDIHAEHRSYLGGVHFELSGDNVTECIGGARGLAEADLERAYESNVDPRLNYEQSLEMALLIARRMSRLNGRTAE